MTLSKDTVVAVIGLGYVGLPLAVELARQYTTIGFDRHAARVANIQSGCDPTGEVHAEDLQAVLRPGGLEVSADPAGLSRADFLIVAVPTPVDAAHIPDFSPLIAASITVGQHMKAGAIVIYESTVYPGATEEVCIPVLERESGLQWQRDFHVGYSPERVNPGDKARSITRIMKVVSGDDEATLQAVGDLYASVITAGVHRASSLRVAEAAKVIENTQRDLNIALMNELSLIFNTLGIDTQEVLEAAGTKWNFLPFRPGLVGGHCIGVDPYYLTHKAEMMGYHPQVILAGRRINDGMAAYVAQQCVKQMTHAGRAIKGARVIVLGLAFKENCPDLRNSKVADLVRELQDYGCALHVHDPLACPDEALHEYGITLTPWDALPKGEALILAVDHQHYRDRGQEGILSKLEEGGVLIDVKSALPCAALRRLGYRVWRL
jgi:UDP-N-acetyl-D-galactosamine dehydrogenase